MNKKLTLVILGAILLLTANLHAGIFINTADVNNDHRVDTGDLSDFAAAYLTEHTPDPNWNPACDIADPADGVINNLDFSGLAANWKWSGAIPDPNQWAFIPSGEFLMGDHHGDDSFGFEGPVHAVYVDAFYMGRYEVTHQQYCDYLNSADSGGQIKVTNGIVYASSDDPNSYPYFTTSSASTGSPVRSEHSHIDYNGIFFWVKTKGGRDMSNDPVKMISWCGAVAYCNWRSQQEGYEYCYDIGDPNWPCDFSKKGYRLPTEAEWEYSARGGEHSPYYRFPWGDTISHSQANYYAMPSSYPYDVSPTSGYHPDWYEGGYPYTSVVGSFAPNGYGLYDMTGSVREWCNDWRDSNYYDISPYDNPTGPTSGSSRVFRGGAHNTSAVLCRIAYRSSHTPDKRTAYFGFRVALK